MNSRTTYKHQYTLIVVWLLAVGCCSSVVHADDTYKTRVAPFFEAYCLKCHGPKDTKGELDLHALGDLSDGRELERWEVVLEMLESGEMPPRGEKQPQASERSAVKSWIERRLKDHLNDESTDKVPLTRRLSNVEYENTMRDLLGFRLKLIDRLPKDPTRPYRFNNTAEFMRLGPEQIDRYLECARLAIASAIVDLEKPKTHKVRREWQPYGVDRGLGSDEIAIWGNRRNTPGHGMGVRNFPKTGEFRIRFQASAILPPGVTEMPLRLVMGYTLAVNSSTQRMEPVGTVSLRNSPDQPQVFELRGRIENYPVQRGVVRRNKRQPDSIVITPQNLYDDGTLNDENLFLRWPRKLKMPRAVVNWIEFEAPITDTWPPHHHTRILFESPLRKTDTKAYVKEVLRRFMSRAYRRPATDAEVKRIEKVYELVSPEMQTLEQAMRETLAMVLISPQFLYHTVATDGQASRHYELASKLSYFLWNSMPDDELLRLAAEKRLDDDLVIEQQVQRLLADSRSHDFVRNFSMQWLSLAKMKTVPINRELFPRFLYYVPRGERAGTEEPYRPTIRDFMLDETVGFVAELIKRNASILNIIDSDFAVLNQALAAHYGVSGVVGYELRPITLKPNHHLGGLLTQGAMLVGNGTGSAPHPIYRAVWLREAILGDEVPDPPADVPDLSESAGESAETALTIKDLLTKHRQKESCKNCHARLDPFGIPFERYNAIGRFQPLIPKKGTRVAGFNRGRHKDLAGYIAYLKTINTVAVPADAALPDGTRIDGMKQLKQYLLHKRKDDVVENVVRRLLSYGVGRELTWRDRFEVDELRRKSENHGYRMRDLIVSICKSDAFRRLDRTGKAEKRPQEK